MANIKNITIYFDGTGNNKFNDKHNNEHTNVARLFDAHIGKKTTINYDLEIYQPNWTDKYLTQENEAIYFTGVGSHKEDSLLKAIQGATGLGSEQRVNDAYKAVVAFHNKYPESEISINIVGFSRGAAQARHLANTLIKEGIPSMSPDGIIDYDTKLLPKYGVRINKLGLFDTIASYGIGTTETHIGKDLRIHHFVHSTTHLVAAHEYRDTFDLTSALRKGLNHDVEEILFPGAHSQVGGGYNKDVLSAGPLSYMYNAMQEAGVEYNPLSKYDRKRIDEYNKIIIDPIEVQKHLIDSRIMKSDLMSGEHRSFPLEKGWLFAWLRQEQPFDHPVNGRDIIFEHDDVLQYGPLTQIVKNVQRSASTLIEPAGNEIKEKWNNILGVKPMTAIKPDLDFNSKITDQRMSEIKDALYGSKPTTEHISNLDFKPIPIDAKNKYHKMEEGQYDLRAIRGLINHNIINNNAEKDDDIDNTFNRGLNS